MQFHKYFFFAHILMKLINVLLNTFKLSRSIHLHKTSIFFIVPTVHYYHLLFSQQLSVLEYVE